MSFSSGWLGQIGRALPADALSANQIDDPKAIGDALMGLITGGAVAAALTLSIASLGFYWLAEQQRIERLWLSLLPLGARTQARAIWREVYHEIGVYVRGEAVIVALTTVALLMIFNALHVPGASILAITGGLAQVVPIIGPPLAVLPGTLAALAQGQASAAIALAGAVCALLVIRLLVAPRIFRAGINPNPVLVIVLILALFQAGGVVLMLLAPPLAAAIHTTTRILADNERAKASAPRPGEIASLHTNLDDIAAKIAVDHPDARRIQDMIERARRLVDQAGSVS
jgi:predicted PurR-regulated permease PerM